MNKTYFVEDKLLCSRRKNCASCVQGSQHGSIEVKIEKNLVDRVSLSILKQMVVRNHIIMCYAIICEIHGLMSVLYVSACLSSYPKYALWLTVPWN